MRSVYKTPKNLAFHLPYTWIIPSLIVGAIFILALVLRLWGIGFGLPYEYHVDEDQYVRQAATMGSTGLEPADWYNPPLFKYVLLAEYGAFFVVGKALGWFASTADFGARMSLDPTWLYLLARGTSALLGAFTVLIVAWTGVKAYNHTVGLFSAALIAVAFLPVRESHFAVNDAAAAFMVSLVMLGVVGILKSGSWRWYILAGVGLGLGFATKYHTLAAVAPVILAHFYSPGISLRRPALLRIAVVVAIATTSAILASPYFILTPQHVLADILKLSSSGQIGYLWQIDPDGGYVFYLKTLVWGLGWPLAGLCIVTAIVALFCHHLIDLVLLSYPWLMFLYLGRKEMFFGRFMLPLVAPLVLVSASLIYDVAKKYIDKRSWRTGVLVGVWLILAIPTLISSVRFDSLLTQTDTRTIAKQWIEQNIPDGAHVAMDWLFHCPELSTLERLRANSSRNYVVWIPEFGEGSGMADHSIDWYRQNGYQYLIACSSLYNLSLTDEVENQERQAFYASLDHELNALYTISPTSDGNEPPFTFDEIYGPAVSLWQRERPGPVIKVYRLNQASNE
jgi:hypothetical protein